MKQIAQGAEAVLYQTKNSIIKDRLPKTYRHPHIDSQLRKFRTKREAKVIQKLKQLNFPAPNLIKVENQIIEMQHIPGKKVRDIFNKNYKKLAAEIGKKLAILHQNHIIHGDLTTSNMILGNRKFPSSENQDDFLLFNKEIYFIDFGLSFFSERNEDKAVDLHLLERAMESKHFQVYPDCFKLALKSYQKHYPDAKQVLNRLETVKSRGRNKNK
ncbi:MAG: Kae1-associated serine/threonine protein kinase [Nanoarchaeota archaeon]|nr:Kae1-associated serine/threonine protein kinase [Nanoarchaeota archaeon]